MVICKLKLIQKNDIQILYELLKESLSQNYSSIWDTTLPSFKKSNQYVLKYFSDKKNHDFKKWYVILNQDNKIVGQIFLKKQNEIGYTIFKKYQGKGFAQKAIRLLIKNNPREKYCVMIHKKNSVSIHVAKKLGFKPKGVILEKK